MDGIAVVFRIVATIERTQQSRAEGGGGEGSAEESAAERSAAVGIAVRLSPSMRLLSRHLGLLEESIGGRPGLTCCSRVPYY